MGGNAEVRRVLLAPRDVLVLNEAVEIVSRSGCVWLTEAGDRRDVVLPPGRSFATRGTGEVVITSRGAAELVLRQAKAGAAPARASGWLKRLAAALDLGGPDAACGS